MGFTAGLAKKVMENPGERRGSASPPHSLPPGRRELRAFFGCLYHQHFVNLSTFYLNNFNRIDDRSLRFSYRE